MKTYKSHKTVKAAKILSAEKQSDGRWCFMKEGESGPVPDTTTKEEAIRFRISESDLGYVVWYADGYVSWSPTKAFEEGYEVVN